MNGWWMVLPTLGGVVVLAVLGVGLALAYVVVGIERAITRRGQR